jgi:hypothetical protein
MTATLLLYAVKQDISETLLLPKERSSENYDFRTDNLDHNNAKYLIVQKIIMRKHSSMEIS